MVPLPPFSPLPGPPLLPPSPPWGPVVDCGVVRHVTFALSVTSLRASKRVSAQFVTPPAIAEEYTSKVVTRCALAGIDSSAAAMGKVPAEQPVTVI